MKQEHALFHLLLSRARAIRLELSRRQEAVPAPLERLIASLAVDHHRGGKLFIVRFQGLERVIELSVPEKDFRFYFSESIPDSPQKDEVRDANGTRADRVVRALLEADGCSINLDSAVGRNFRVPAWLQDLGVATALLVVAIALNPIGPPTLIPFLAFILLRSVDLRLGWALALSGVLLVTPLRTGGAMFMTVAVAAWCFCLLCDRWAWPKVLLPFVGAALGVACVLSGQPALLGSATLAIFGGFWFLQPWKFSLVSMLLLSGSFGATVLWGGPLAGPVAGGVFPWSVGGGSIFLTLILLSLSFWFAGTHRNSTVVFSPLYLGAISLCAWGRDPGAFPAAFVLSVSVGMLLLLISRLGLFPWKTDTI
ncbi:MAG: hypothetical protein HYR96_09055 [Deltaproteobacteria bacterium]|nr:hypothetical protein [Deltaproteobacteria bacterium]MBI3293206.1 hypothetical protein [Deltaproteobacteria bacterium]